MKKSLLWLIIILLIFSSAIYGTKENVRQKIVNRNITFVVYKSIDYTSSVYNNTSAQVEITAEKVSGTNRTLVWDTTCETKLLRDYLAMDNASSQTIMFHDVQNGEEHLEITYTCTYNSNGYKLEIKNHPVIASGSTNRLDISI